MARLTVRSIYRFFYAWLVGRPVPLLCLALTGATVATGCTFHVDKPDVQVDKVTIVACVALGPGGSLVGVDCPEGGAPGDASDASQ